MGLTVKVEDPTERPKIGGGRSTREKDESWRELLPLVADVMKLDADKAQPVKVPHDDVPALLSRLRKAGNVHGVTIRFDTYPVLDDEGHPKYVVSNGKRKPVITYAKRVNKTESRVSFWTVAKIHRKRKNSAQTEEAPVTVE